MENITDKYTNYTKGNRTEAIIRLYRLKYPNCDIVDEMIIVNKVLNNNDDILKYIPVVIECGIKHSVVMLHSKDGKLLKPRIGHLNVSEFLNIFGKDSHVKGNTLYTNLGTLLEATIKYSEIPFNMDDDLFSYKLLKLKLPTFLNSDIREHTSTLLLSDPEVTEVDVEVVLGVWCNVHIPWRGYEFINKYKSEYTKSVLDGIFKELDSYDVFDIENIKGVRLAMFMLENDDGFKEIHKYVKKMLSFEVKSEIGVYFDGLDITSKRTIVRGINLWKDV